MSSTSMVVTLLIAIIATFVATVGIILQQTSALRKELKSDMAELKSELKSDMAAMEQRLNDRIAGIETRMSSMETTQIAQAELLGRIDEKLSIHIAGGHTHMATASA
ncbi:MAG: hypothetical protein M1399_05600 [Actinobacteria bacterium]|nr:hypothetical protein [Actinomycetota bacterium]